LCVYTDAVSVWLVWVVVFHHEFLQRFKAEEKVVAKARTARESRGRKKAGKHLALQTPSLSHAWANRDDFVKKNLK